MGPVVCAYFLYLNYVPVHLSKSFDAKNISRTRRDYTPFTLLVNYFATQQHSFVTSQVEQRKMGWQGCESVLYSPSQLHGEQ
jgi:hypothetical protein